MENLRINLVRSSCTGIRERAGGTLDMSLEVLLRRGFTGSTMLHVLNCLLRQRQLEYMGTNVIARSISVNKNKPLNVESVKQILQGFINIIN